MLSPKKILILTNLIPHYRKHFFDLLIASENYQITIVCEKKSPGCRIETVNDHFRTNIIEVGKIKFNNLFSFHLIFSVLKISDFDIIVFDGNPRHISFALFSTFARLLGKPVIIWSTFNSRRNNKISIKLRLVWWRIFKYFLVYTEYDAEKLKNIFSKKKLVISINNGLDQNDIDNGKTLWPKKKLHDWQVQNNLVNKNILISSGRLVAGRFNLILDVIKILVQQNPSLLWVLIGEGEDDATLSKNLKENNLENNVLLAGAIYDEAELAPYFMSSNLFIYSEAIGLSLMHAFGYGLPVVIHNKFDIHGSEARVFKNSIHGFAFEYGSAQSMAIHIKELLENEEMRSLMSMKVLETVRTEYNCEVMAKKFFQMVDNILII
jgi:glycosyltransferase involved in cell wall biosynthesis